LEGNKGNRHARSEVLNTVEWRLTVEHPGSEIAGANTNAQELEQRFSNGHGFRSASVAHGIDSGLLELLVVTEAVLVDLVGTIIRRQPDLLGSKGSNFTVPNKRTLEYAARSVYTSHPGLTLMEFTEELTIALAGKEDRLLKRSLLSLGDSTIENSRLIDGARRALEEMRRLRCRLVAVSNSTPVMHQVIRKLGLDKVFDSTVLSCDIGILKPDARIFKIVIDSVKGTNENSCMIGDTWETDIVGALRAKCKAVFVDNGLVEPRLSCRNRVVEIPSIEFVPWTVRRLF